MTSLGVTGHRLSRLTTDRNCDRAKQRLKDLAKAVIQKHQPTKVYCGMEWTGWDKAIALAVLETRNVALVACIPYEGHQKQYAKFLSQFPAGALEVVIVSDGGYAPWKMQRRNEYIVNHCDQLVALWDGTKKGGTYNCLKYAEGRVEAVNVWDSWVNHK